MQINLFRNHVALRKPISLACSLLFACSLAATGLIAGPASAARAQTVTICLTNATSYCADVKDSHDVSGQPIWLYNSSGAGDYHWVMITGVQCVAGTNCYYFEDAADTSLCLSTTVGRDIVLGSCSSRGSWYSEGGNLLGNGAYGAGYTLMVHSDTDESLLVALPAGQPGYWEKWNY